MITKESYPLFLEGMKEVYVTNIEGELYIELGTVLKQFAIDPKTKFGEDIVIVPTRLSITIGEIKRRVDFIDMKIFEILYRNYANSPTAQILFEKVMKHKRQIENNFLSFTSNDLVSEEQRDKYIDEVNSIIKEKISIEVELKHLKPFIKDVKSIYGAKLNPILFEHVNDYLKYSKKIPVNQIAEDLRGAGRFDKDNMPLKAFADRGWFKVIILSEAKLTKTKIEKRVLVYQGGIKEIERIIDNKYGGKYK